MPALRRPLLSSPAKSLLAPTLAIGALLGFTQGTRAADPAADFKKNILPILEDTCYDCHGEGTKKGDFALDKYQSLDAHLKNIELWYDVWKNVQSQLMPPAEKQQIPPEKRAQLLEWIETAVFKVDPKNPDPGRVTIRRLNRAEYENTILDLLGVKFDADDAFPADDTGYGFDTIGDVLTISPLLMEKYVTAAQEIVEDAVAETGARIPTLGISGDKFRTEDKKKNGKFIPFADPITISHTQPIQYPGRYKATVTMRAQGSSEATSHTAKVTLNANGKPADSTKVGWEFRKEIKLVTEIDLHKGDNPLSLDIAQDAPPQEGEKQLNLVVTQVSLYGPLDGSHTEYPKEYFRVFMDGPPPADAAARAVYARKILRNLADRAYRRPIDEPSLDRLTKFADSVAGQPKATFETGIGHALTAILASPRFLFRAEIQPEPNNAGRIVPIDEFALASRLSFFLWSSIPDDELFNLARDGKLRANLRAQVDRMLADPRSRRFVSNFVGQWLQTRDVAGLNIDPRKFLNNVPRDEAFKIFSQRLREAMRDETELLFAHLLTENRPALDLLTADYTFLNEQLATFYGIPNVKGSEMRKVPLTPENGRPGGILTHGSTLVVTSNPTRTSPVKRGLFILENILGTPAPPAPPNVPELERAQKPGAKLTMRELMVVHREAPLCSSCHARMDPLGLAFENFTPIGTFRGEDNGKPIDTAGQLITGEKFTNVEELAQVLATSRRDDFYRCLTEKLLTYATGRGLEYYDTVTIDQIVATLESNKGAMRSLIYGIVESAPFQKRRGDGPRVATAK